MITVFTSCYNQGEYLAQAIESVLNQTFSDFEYLIYDDGSTDNTWEIIQSYAQKDKRIRPFKISKSPNVGVVINQSIKQARGNVWTWCPSDDIWLPNLLEAKNEEAKKYPGAIFYSDWILVDEHGRQTGQVQPARYTPEEFKEVVWTDSPIGFTGIWIPVKTFEVAGLFPEHLSYSEDFYWMIKATIHDMEFRCVPQFLYKKRTHSNTTTKKNLQKILQDVPRIREELRRYKASLKAIPRKMHFFWANESMSWMRYMTLLSFRKLNPDWEIELHLCRPNEIKHKPWADEPIQDFFNFSGTDYIKEARKLDITVKQWDLEGCDGANWRDIVCPSQKSNFFKWQKLATDGGFYSDLDILYLRPMDDYYEKVKDCDLVICYRNRYFSIGFLGSSPGNKFYKDIFQNAFDTYDGNRYQTVGVENVYTFLKKISNTPPQIEPSQIDLWRLIEKHYPDIKAYNNRMELVYPWSFDEMEEVFNCKHTNIPDDCIGIHWYAGDKLSQEFNNLLTKENYRDFDNTFCYFADKVLNGRGVEFGANGKRMEDSDIVPTPKEFIRKKSRLRAKRANLVHSRLLIKDLGSDGLYHLRLAFRNNGKEWENTVAFPYTGCFREFLAVDPKTNEDLLVTAGGVYNALRQGYDFSAAWSAFRRNRLTNRSRPSVAFTVKHSSVIGGGTALVFKYANWLYDSGIDVAVYSDDEPPDWMDVKCRFYYIEDIRQRYAAITEPVIIVYSILELQDLLFCCDTKDKVIYHLCQGIEDYHYYLSTYHSLMAPKTIFEFLFSLPVGRLAVSPHIRDYFRRNYDQKTYDIFNGIDLDYFAPKPKNSFDKNINILSSGNPSHLFKGKADIRKALDLAAENHPELNFTLTIADDAINFDKDLFGPGGHDFSSEVNYRFGECERAFTCKVRYGLSRDQMRRAYYDSDIYINSSWYEGFGLPTLEAMACGLPVIQADNLGLDGIVADRKNCLVIPPNNPQKMAEAIETLIKDETLRNDLIQNGFETAKQFSEIKQREAFVDQFEKILQCDLRTTPEDAKTDKEDLEDTEPEINKPLFTVLVPTYNQAKYLPEALDSLINQTCQDWEAVVVDDGSTDDTANVMAHYAQKDPRIRIFHKENGGVGSALNEGLRNSRGRWICWLSSDDMFEPDKLQVHIQAMKEHPDIRFFHTSYYIFDEKIGAKCTLQEDPATLVSPVELQVLKFFERNCCNGISVAVHREVFDRVGLFDEKYRYGQDFDMWLRINAHYRAHFIDRKTVVTRWHSSRDTSSFPEAGFYDSGRSCVQFLNTHKFSDCFGLINLTTLNGAAKAVKETLAVVCNAGAMMYRLCFNTVLLERLCEWICQECHQGLRRKIIPRLQSLVSDIANSQLPEEIRAGLSKFSEDITTDFHFSPHDLLHEAAQYAKKLYALGQKSRAKSIERYLSLVKYENDIPDSACGRTALVSVIMPAYNAAGYIKKSIESVLAQDYANFELIVVDDGSTDNTPGIIKGFKDNRIRYFYRENEGASSARNTAILKSAGDFVIPLDSDDMLTPDFISRHLDEFERHPGADLIYCDDLLIDEEDKPIRVIERPAYKDRKVLVRNLFRSGFPIVPFRTCIRKSVFDRIGFFDEALPVAEDYDMMRRFVEKGLKTCHLRGALYMRRMTDNSLSRRFTEEKAKAHFAVVERFVETFSCDELFPDVEWEKIEPQRRHLNARCLAAMTIYTIGKSYSSNAPVYTRVASERARSLLNDCLRAEPKNVLFRKLARTYELIRPGEYRAMANGQLTKQQTC